MCVATAAAINVIAAGVGAAYEAGRNPLPPRRAKFYTCPYCKSTFDYFRTKCENCGALLPPNSKEYATNQEEIRRSRYTGCEPRVDQLRERDWVPPRPIQPLSGGDDHLSGSIGNYGLDNDSGIPPSYVTDRQETDQATSGPLGLDQPPTGDPEPSSPTES